MMAEDSSNDINRRSVLRKAASAGVAAGVLGGGSVGSASAVTVESDEALDVDVPAAIEAETEDLRAELSAQGYLSEASAEQLDLEARVGGRMAASISETGYRTSVTEDGEVRLSVSHNTDEANMAMFVHPDSGEAHAVVEADGRQEIVTADGTVAYETCDIQEYCSMTECGCEDEVLDPGDFPWEDPTYIKTVKGNYTFEKCCWTSGGSRAQCWVYEELDCGSCRETRSGQC